MLDLVTKNALDLCRIVKKHRTAKEAKKTSAWVGGFDPGRKILA